MGFFGVGWEYFGHEFGDVVGGVVWGESVVYEAVLYGFVGWVEVACVATAVGGGGVGELDCCVLLVGGDVCLFCE